MSFSRLFKKLIVILFTINAAAAQGVTIGSNNPPSSSAGLDLDFTNGGLLLPRLTTTQRNAINSPQAGLQIYNLDTDCLELYFQQGGWKPVNCGCTAFPNASFTAPSGSVNSLITFSAPQAGLIYSWSFQSGNPATGNTQVAQAQWSSPGTYGVTLIATDSAGCSSSFTDSVTLSLCSPFTFVLTPCGASGRLGPTQSQCNSTYGLGVVTSVSGVQEYVVPQTGTYTITVRGAQGGAGNTGSNTGGLGAIVRGQLNLNQNDTLWIGVGQAGINNGVSGTAGGGGGASYVRIKGQNTPLLVAGGGGGGRGDASPGNGHDAPTTINGGSSPTSTCSFGGTNGNGAIQNCSSSGSGDPGGGAGWFTNGSSGCGFSTTNCTQGGVALINGGLGSAQVGSGTSCSGPGGEGGFGGGAAGSGCYGGGGGGYSGGGAGDNTGSTEIARPGSGGGCFVASTVQNLATSNGQYNSTNVFNGNSIGNLGNSATGNGTVTIALTCP
jgi:hypothetical protein